VKYYLIQKLLSARLHFALGLLLLVLQRSPVLKMLAHAQQLQLNAPIARILQAIALPAVAASTPHALSGATNSTYSVDPQNPFQGTVGETVVVGFSINIQPRSWSVSGEVPPGLRVTDLRQRQQLSDGLLVANYGLVSGTPTSAGSWELTLTPWGNDDGTGEGPPDPLILRIEIEADNSEPTLPSPPEIKIGRVDDSLTLTWQIDPEHNFQAQVSNDFKTWTSLSAPPAISDGIARIDIPVTSIGNTFYRLALTEEN